MMTTAKMSMAAVSLVMIALSLWRWHDHDASAPIFLDADRGPGALLVVNERDCAESPRWLAHWITPLLREGVPVRAVRVRSGSPARGEVGLGDGIVLPLVELRSERLVMKALSRARVRQTPALILLDGLGAPMLVEGLHEAAPLSIEPFARALAGLHRHREAHPVSPASGR